MSRIQRVRSIVTGLLMIASAVFLLYNPDDGYFVLLLVISISLIASGVKTLSYYFTMARHMVGGGHILWKGVLLLEIGIYTILLTDIPASYIMIYLLAGYIFDGAIDIMRAFEAKKIVGAHWKLNLTYGIINLIIAGLCIVNLKSYVVSVYIYCAGIITSAIGKIISACRKSAIVYIQ